MVYAISLALPLGELSPKVTERASPCAKLHPFGMNFGFSVGKRTAPGREDWKRYYDASVVVWDEETIIYADLDMALTAACKMEHDAVGHYARPDVLELVVHDR